MSDALHQPAQNSIIVQATWSVEPGADSLDPHAWDRLPAYIVRYAQTLGVIIFATGGTDDHIHLLLELPASKSLDSVTSELQRAVARFLKETLGLREFGWDRSRSSAQSIGRADFEEVRDYIASNSDHHRQETTIPDLENVKANGVEDPDAMPAWLRDVMPKK